MNYADHRDILYEEFYEKIRKQKTKHNFYGRKNQKINIFYVRKSGPLGFPKLTVEVNAIIL